MAFIREIDQEETEIGALWQEAEDSEGKGDDSITESHTERETDRESNTEYRQPKAKDNPSHDANQGNKESRMGGTGPPPQPPFPSKTFSRNVKAGGFGGEQGLTKGRGRGKDQYREPLDEGSFGYKKNPKDTHKNPYDLRDKLKSKNWESEKRK